MAVKNGIVTFSSSVNTYGQQLMAEHAATNVAGVKVVAVDIEVKVDDWHW